MGRKIQTPSDGSVAEVVRLGWPIVVSMLSYTAMGVADVLFVGWVGKAEVAGTGLAVTAIFLVNSFFLGLLAAVKVVAAQATGAGDLPMARSAGWQGLFLAAPAALLVIVLGQLHEPIFALFGAEPAVSAFAGEYFAVRVFAAPFAFAFITLCNAFQGMGDTRTPMVVNLWVNGANIVLDPLFIFGAGPIPAMGVAGAGLATVIACAGGLVLTWVYWAREAGTPVRPDRALLASITRLGIPLGVRFTLDVSGWTVFVGLLARMGETQLAAHVIAVRIVSISFLPGYAISEAAAIMTGQFVGARDYARVRRAFRSALIVAIVVMAAFGVVFLALPDALLGLFQPDPDVLAVGRQLLLVAAAFQVVDAVAMVATGALNGVGDTRTTMIVSILASWLVMVPLAYLLGTVLELGPAGGWIAIAANFLVVGTALTWRFVRGTWRGVGEVVAQAPAPD